MPKWNEWIYGLEIKDDLETLLEEVRSEIKSIKTKNLIEQDKLDTIKKNNIQKCIQWCTKYKLPYNKNIQQLNAFLTQQ